MEMTKGIKSLNRKWHYLSVMITVCEKFRLSYAPEMTNVMDRAHSFTHAHMRAYASRVLWQPLPNHGIAGGKLPVQKVPWW